MGTWASNNFGNDGACDFRDELVDQILKIRHDRLASSCQRRNERRTGLLNLMSGLQNANFQSHI